ncbi:MAG: hypothetical protein WD357_07965, partial [Gracilimonas sp.]
NSKGFLPSFFSFYRTLLIYTLIPMVFLMIMTLWAMTEQVIFDWSGMGANDSNMLLFVFGAVILGFTIWIILEAVVLIRKE